jgi:hypothetical protein
VAEIEGDVAWLWKTNMKVIVNSKQRSYSRE